jgi:hypothetical protein
MYEPLLLGILYYFTQLPWTFIFLLTQMFGIRLYTLTDSEDCKRIQKRVSGWSTHTTDNDKGYGYSIGYWYIVNISISSNDYGDKYIVWMIATEASYKSLLNGKTEATLEGFSLLKSEINKTDITIFERIGSLSNPWYKKRALKIKSMVPRPNQDVVIQQIKEHHAEHGHTVAYLYGAPGTGKSVIGILLANMYKSSYCNTLKPWQPGDNVGSLYSDVEPTAEAPFILVFDEFDRPLQQINAGIKPHPKLPIQLADKTGWNQLLDEIHIGVYPNLILLLTSNTSPDNIREMDPSYIREGRVDLLIGM